MLRKILLWMLNSEFLQKFATKCLIPKELSRRFVAGETLEDAIKVVRKLNEKGIRASLIHLGENVTKVEEAEAAANACIEMLDAIGAHQLEASISLQLTQLGVDIDKNFTAKLIRKIARRAAKHKTSVRIDMEGSDYTQRTLDLYKKLHKKYPKVGVVIQSMLLRSEQDIMDLIEYGANVRLCKGAYKEPADIAYQDKSDVDDNLMNITTRMFSEYARARGAKPCVATHDERIIDYTKRFVEEHDIPKDRFEFQMLHGIRPDLQMGLAQEGYTVRVYVPYGEQWCPYFVRRLAERPANLWFFIKNLFRK